MRATQRLAVDGNDLIRKQVSKGTNPCQETALECRRIKVGEDTPECVVRRDTVGQVEKGAEPFLLGVAKVGYLCPAISATDDGADGNDQDIQQFVPLGAVNARVFEAAKVLLDGCIKVC